MTIKHLFPKALPTLNLDFANSKALDPRITFSRSSSGTYVDSDGLIKTAVTDAPRFDHDPVTGESLGLLIEESRTNLLTYSEQFDDGSYITAAFQAVAPTKTPNQATAPDGSLTADKIDYPAVSGANTYSLIYRNAVTLSGSHSSSIYLRGAVGGEKVYLFYIVDGIHSNTLCTLTTEWQRFSVIFTGGTPSYWHLGVDLRSGSGQVAQSASTIYAWGAQLEAGSFPTSYIPTTSSAVTRAADLASIEGTNFSSWYNQSEGTWFTEAKSDDGSNGVFGVGSSTNSIGGLSYDFNGFNAQWQGSVMDGAFNPVDDSFHKFAFTATRTSNTLTADGVQNDTGTATVSFDATELGIGVRDAYGPGFGSVYLNGHIARLAYFPTRLPDEQLQTLTS